MTAVIAGAAFYEVVLAVHIMAVMVAFGVTFAYPIMFALTAKHEPRSLPLMHRVATAIDRMLVNGGLVVVLAAGAYLASKGHSWSEFFVQWGLGAVLVIGALVGAVMIPAGKRARALAERDLEASGDGEIVFSAEYQAVVRRLQAVGSLLSGLVLLTILFMAIQP
jgi:MFS family permease